MENVLIYFYLAEFILLYFIMIPRLTIYTILLKYEQSHVKYIHALFSIYDTQV